jgi:hypothetical protein
MYAKMPRLLPALLACCLPFPLAAAEPGTSTLDWISGHWCGTRGDERIEEYWMAPGGEALLGLGRTLKDGRLVSFEYLRIENADGVPAYVAHPNGSPPTRFRRTAGGPDWARFENPGHDFPRRVEYRRRGDALYAQIAGPGEDGGEVVIPFEYRACP